MIGLDWLDDGSSIPDPHGRGQKAVEFVRRLRLHEGRSAGKRFPLAPFQEGIIRRVYGSTGPDGKRIIRTVFMMIPRGNGKTAFASTLALLHLLGPEREAGGQVYAAAADREQASIAFRSALGMIAQDDYLKKLVRSAPSQKTIVHPKSRSVFKALSHEAYTKHGLSASFIICDEVHAWPTRELYDVLEGSTGKREEPLNFIITTAGQGEHNLCADLRSYARKVASGEIDDPTFLPILFEPEPDDDWQDEAVWHRLNPALAAGFRSLHEMRVKARRALEVPAEREAFKRYYLNFWSDGAAAPWLEMSVYDEGAEPIDEESYLGEPCWIGVDLASVEDLTAVVAVLKRPEGGYVVLPRFFLPEETLRRRADDVPYKEWADAGHITVTPGAVVDYAVVEDAIIDFGERFQVMEIPIDRWNSTGTQTRLLEEGLPVIKFGQGFASMSPACKEVERAILSRELQHGGHPVLRWCFRNVVIDEDPAGNVKFNKAKSADKIDGAVAAAMAVARAAAAGGPGIYEDAEERPDGIVFL